MDLNIQDRPILAKYRDRSVWGGCAVGALIGALVGGPHVASWTEPVKTYLLYIIGSAAIGIVLGYVFYALFLGGLTSRAAGVDSRSDTDHIDDHSNALPSAEHDRHTSDFSGSVHD